MILRETSEPKFQHYHKSLGRLTKGIYLESNILDKYNSTAQTWKKDNFFYTTKVWSKKTFTKKKCVYIPK